MSATQYKEDAGKVRLFFLVVLVALLGALAWKISSTSAPSIEVKRPPRGIGQSTLVSFDVVDLKHHVKRVLVEVRQEGRSFVVSETGFSTPAWWQFWRSADGKPMSLSVRVGRKELPELKEGRATLRLVAVNDSWGHFFRGGRREVLLDLPVRFVPPQIEVLSTHHYINQGGAELVVVKITPNSAEIGVQVGHYYFPGWPLREATPELRLCLFAFPHDLDARTPIRLLGRDEAGNETVTSFSYQVFPKRFRSDKINLSDEFMARVVPAILSRTPEVTGSGNRLEDFLLVNGRLRGINAKQLVAHAQNTHPHFLWSAPFLPLGNASVEAGFADQRTYLYQGKEVDRQTHLGFDLAVVERTPVTAANDGKVIFAGFFGIYGNSIIIDHGCGLQSLYSHLSSMDVKDGETVKRGQVIGRSGQTGLAGGDHLHFGMLLQGIPINPVEWWDPHWIHDRIQAKLAPYR